MAENNTDVKNNFWRIEDYGTKSSRFDPGGRDWVESSNGDITWRKDVTSKNYKNDGVLKDGEIYRGTSYQREKIWNNVNVGGNIENGLMAESYNPIVRICNPDSADL